MILGSAMIRRAAFGILVSTLRAAPPPAPQP
jgi:hypothetical protein